MQSEYQQMSEHYSSSRTTMRQMSIEKYHPEQEVQPFFTKRDLESIAKLIAENVADKLDHGQKTSSTSVETGHLGQALDRRRPISTSFWHKRKISRW